MLCFALSLVLATITVAGRPESAPVKGGIGAKGLEGALGVVAAWSGDYGKALAVARASNKPLLVIIEKRDDPQQCVNDAVTLNGVDATDLAGRFELCRVDATTHYGQQLANAFGVYQYPFTAISTRDGVRIAYRRQGAISSEQLQAALGTVQDHSFLRPSFDVETALTPWERSAVAPPKNCPNCRLRQLNATPASARPY